MSELFTQTNKQKKLFRTEEDIVANIQTQFGMPHTGKDLLLDAKMGPNKDKSSRLDLEPDALSDTGMSDDVGAGDTSGILHDSAGGNKNTITGTNTPRSSRASAYYDLLRSQHKNGHYKAPAYRVVDAIESPLQAGAGALNYHDDFDTDAIQNAGLHMAVAQTVVEGNIMAAAADSAFVIGKQTGNILKDLKDETINAKDALKAGGQVLRLQGGKSVVKIGGATLRSTEQYLSSFQASTDDFTGSVPGKVKEAATNTGNILKKITNVVLHPLRNLIAMGKVILIGAVILLFLIIVSLLGQMSGTTSTSVFGANRIEDIQTLVQKINDYRNAAVTEGIYQAFQNDVDPNGNPYGYDSLTGQRSNNLQHGVTWNYANGIYNDTAEIISFSNATAIPWCPGELNDGQYGHYDLDCTIYLTGYDRYTDPETQAPNGADGGTGNLEALAESCDAGTLTRTIIKQDQYGNEYAGNAVSARYTKTITLPNGARGFQGWYKDGEDAYGNVEWASLLYRMDWEGLYDIVDGIKCRATGSGMTEEELRQLFASLNIDATTARGQVVAFALSCQGKFVYAQPSSLRGGPGNPSVGINLDCSSFVQYCYWAQNLPFSAGSTAVYRNAADLVSISPSEVQPGDLRVVYASGGEQGHVQMALGGDAWIECCYGYGVAVNMSNAWMESRPCYYFRYAGF